MKSNLISNLKSNLLPNLGLEIPERVLPIQDAALKLWLDADDSATITKDMSDNVSDWADKSTNGNDVSQLTATNQPLFVASAINSNPSIRFDGVDNYLENLGISLVTGVGELTIFMAISRISSPNNNRGKLALWETGQIHDFNNIPSVSFEDGSIALNELKYLRNTSNQNKTPHPNENTPFIYSSIFDGANNNSFLNGNIASFTNPTGSAGNFNIQNIRVGARQVSGSASFFWNGDIGEIIIYNRDLSTLERQQVESYLSSKWSITLI